MKVHTSDSSFQMVRGVAEVRYDDGLQYYDHCGEALSRIRKSDSAWHVDQVNVGAGEIRHLEKKLLISFNSDRFSVSARLAEWQDLHSAESTARQLASELQNQLPLVLESLRISEVTRLGVRFQFVAKSDTFDDAEHFVLRSMGDSWLAGEAGRALNGKAYSAEFSYRFEDLESGVRYTVNINPVARMNPGSQSSTGLSSPNAKASGVSVDVDTFTLPISIEAFNYEQFVIQCYNTTRDLAQRLVRSMAKEIGSRT